jgi:hypothetical protein
LGAVTRTKNDLAGVFEFDGEVGYFYLYRNQAAEGKRIVSSIHIVSGTPGFEQADVEIRWTAEGAVVGLFIYSVLWAAFDAIHLTKFGGNYRSHGKPEIPDKVASCFQ